MKNCIFIFSVILILFSCQNTNNNNIDNGIDKRILRVIDSLPLCPDNHFVTVWFAVDTLKNQIIIIENNAIVPAPEWEPYREVLISEMSDFKGYKKYNDWYIIFLQWTFNNKFDRFVVADSLKSDEEPFEKYGIYEWKIGKKSHCFYERIEKVYRIVENDSLILLNRDNDNIYR